jgi:hypothetical protein
MQHDSLSDRTLVVPAMPPQSMGAGAVNGATIDTLGWDGIRFEISVGVITGAGTLDARVVRDDNSGMSSPTNVANAALAQVVNTTPNTVHVIDVYRPSERYVRAVITQATNTVIASATATLYRRSGLLPPTQTATQVVRVAEN